MPQTLIDTADLFVAEFLETATISGTAYDCIATSPLSTDVEVGEVGADPVADVALIFQASTPRPAIGTLLTFRSTEYRVTRVSRDSIDATFTVSLAPRYGGAS